MNGYLWTYKKRKEKEQLPFTGHSCCKLRKRRSTEKISRTFFLVAIEKKAIFSKIANN